MSYSVAMGKLLDMYVCICYPSPAVWKRAVSKPIRFHLSIYVRLVMFYNTRGRYKAKTYGAKRGYHPPKNRNATDGFEHLSNQTHLTVCATQPDRVGAFGYKNHPSGIPYRPISGDAATLHAINDLSRQGRVRDDEDGLSAGLAKQVIRQRHHVRAARGARVDDHGVGVGLGHALDDGGPVRLERIGRGPEDAATQGARHEHGEAGPDARSRRDDDDAPKDFSHAEHARDGHAADPVRGFGAQDLVLGPIACVGDD